MIVGDACTLCFPSFLLVISGDPQKRRGRSPAGSRINLTGLELEADGEPGAETEPGIPERQVVGVGSEVDLRIFVAVILRRRNHCRNRSMANFKR